MTLSIELLLGISVAIFFFLRQLKTQKYSEIALICLSFTFLFFFWGSSIFLVLIPALIGYVSSFKPKENKAKITYYLVLLASIVVWYSQAKFNFFGFRGESVTLEGLALLGASYILIRLCHIIKDGYQIDSYISRLNYLLFLPAIPIGPIHNIKEYKTSKITPPGIIGSQAYIGRGLYGIFKIFILSSAIAPYALDFDNVVFFEKTVFLNIVLSLCAYSLYLYWNFSGAIDIVISLSRLIGWKVPENFDLPFLATNIQDFWRRWHMSLTNSLRDLVFIPFVKSITTKKYSVHYYLVTFAGILIVFIISALWHNLSVNYLLWGLWHAFFMVLYSLFKICNVRFGKITAGYFLKVLSTIFTFLIVSCGWLFFIYPSVFILEKALNYSQFTATEVVLDKPYSNTILVNYKQNNNGYINAYLDDGTGEKLYQKKRSGEYNFIHFHGSGEHRSLRNGYYQVRLEFFSNKDKLLYTYKAEVDVQHEQ